ncbi:PQQ-binding-like beta-propeller repeat protein [Micromonospora krabiensis]|uniref:outer membrane protein assembly factor BamB family protein n=1 Tax=Micromonospora krabiensis TaxID=307121 RepID=UPI0012FD72E1|nr:PQQ-binding-like beta-propeller repeat protein [Micromonospora krabiensis]
MIFEARWRRQLHQHGSSSAFGGWAAAPDLIVVHERSTRLVGVDLRDGATVWDAPFGTWPRAVVIVGDRCLGIAQNIPQLVCFDLSSGQRLWSADLPGFTGHIVSAGGVVLVGGWRGYTPLMAFDLRDGAPLWRSPGRVTTVAPMAVGAQVLLADPATGEIRLIDPRDGSQVNAWSLPEPVVSDDSRTVFATLEARRLLVASALGAQWKSILRHPAPACFQRPERDCRERPSSWVASSGCLRPTAWSRSSPTQARCVSGYTSTTGWWG